MASKPASPTPPPADPNAAASAAYAARNPGTGGETHQTAASSDQALTTNQGAPISDNQNSLKAGSRGPTLLEDFILREKITHFDHERIPERIVHARGRVRTATSSPMNRVRR